MVIGRGVPEYEREFLWVHTREIRAKRHVVDQWQLEALKATMEKAMKDSIRIASTYTRMSRKHISIQTLNTPQIDYELDQVKLSLA
jgi:aryl-phospho-beta-D-glucosidase BglC (GH1 family)